MDFRTPIRVVIVLAAYLAIGIGLREFDTQRTDVFFDWRYPQPDFRQPLWTVLTFPPMLLALACALVWALWPRRPME